MEKETLKESSESFRTSAYDSWTEGSAGWVNETPEMAEARDVELECRCIKKT